VAHKRPWYQRNGSAMVMGTLHMPSAEHKWAYSTIIDMLNDREGPLPDDPGFICGLTGLSKRRWTEVRKYLLADRDPQGETRLMIDENGDITNPRFERERAKRRGEAEKAAEWGREGGKASAAKRQGELGFDPEKSGKTGEKPHHKAEKNGCLSPDNIGETEGDDRENNDLGQGPPQATRAREPASEAKRPRVEEQESSPANPSNRANGSAVDAFDLLGLMNRLAGIGGVAIINPSKIAANVDIVKAWLAAGYDVEETIVPAITAQHRDTREKSIGSLNFYSGRIAKLHAETVAASTPRGPEEKAVLTFEGEDHVMSVIRRDLHKALGNWAYCSSLNHLGLRVVDGMGEGDKRKPLEAVGDLNRFQLLQDSERRAIVRRTIAQYGFTDLWQRPK
jgi:uncharacterized protein YdaU (DUF1376 family)